jgi:hypothetical protein
MKLCLGASTEKELSLNMKIEKTSIQISPETRDRLYKFKFRKTYDRFLSELCDMYEERELEHPNKK